MENYLLQEFFGNTIQDYVWFISSICLGLIFKKLISKYLSRLIFKFINKKHSEIGVEKFDSLLTKPIGLCIMLSVIFLGSSHIQFPIEWNLANENEIGLRMLIKKGFSLLFLYSVFWILLKMIDLIGLILYKKAELTENKMDDQIIPFIIEI